MNGLSGRRVLVTRSAERATEMIALLGERGATAVLLPAIRSVPVEDPSLLRNALRHLAEYDWLVFTSATAVNVVFDMLGAAGALPLPRKLRIAAVGTVTATAIGQRGAPAHAVPSAFRGEALGRAIDAGPGTRVLLPRADIARAETAAALRASGALVDDVIAYQTVLVQGDARVPQAIAGVDAVTFASPSAVHGLSRAAAGELPRLATTLVVASIGPTTSAAVRECGMSVHVEPVVHTAAALVQALDAHFAALTPRAR